MWRVALQSGTRKGDFVIGQVPNPMKVANFVIAAAAAGSELADSRSEGLYIRGEAFEKVAVTGSIAVFV